MNKTVLTTLAVVVVILGIASVLVKGIKYQETEVPVGAIGTNPIENYVPAILYNEGYYSLLPITTTGLLTPGSLKLGANGTSATKLIFTSPNYGETNRCDWILTGNGSTGSTFNATSTRNFDCAVTGVTAGDSIVASLPTTTPSVYGGVRIIGVNASTTAGFVTFTVYNGTGASVTLGQSTVGSSTVVHVLDN